MPNRIPKLTRRAVEAIKPNGADTIYWDGELTGFALRIRKSGRKNYVLQTRVRGKLRWFTIGQHGRITADEARAAALEILAQAKKGIDPRDADAKAGGRAGHGRSRQALPRGVCPRPLQAQHPGGIPAVSGALHRSRDRRDADRGGWSARTSPSCTSDLRDRPYQANRTLGVLSKMFLARGNLGPAAGRVPIPAGTSSATRRASASGSCRPRRPSGWARFLAEAESEMPSAVAAFRLLLLTGCRLSEIQFLRWEYVKDDCIELPDAKTGGRRRAARARGPRRRADGPARRGRKSLGHPRQAAGVPHHRSPAPLAPHPRARRAGGRANS